MCSHDRQHIFLLEYIIIPKLLLKSSLTRSILCPLLSIGQFITNLARGETALRTETEPIEGIYLAASVGCGDDRSLIFQHRRFGGYQTQNHLLAISHILQRLETTRTLHRHTPDRRYLHLMSEEIRSYWHRAPCLVAGMIIATYRGY